MGIEQWSKLNYLLLIFASHMYKVLRNLLFLLPGEQAHYFSMNVLRLACSIGFVRIQLAKIFMNPVLNNPNQPPSNSTSQTIHFHQFGLDFKNPVGLGAGFDKNATYLRELETLGFGFMEIGTVTPKPQPGNDQPRMFRLPADQALINRMGFNNDGVEAIAERMRQWRTKTRRKVVDSETGEGAKSRSNAPPFRVGGNIGKNKNTSNEDAWKDYETCFLALHPYVDFFVVNVSSPNTPGLRALQEKEALRKILVNLQHRNQEFELRKPLLLKISPDLSWPQIDDVVELALNIHLDGLVVSNTTTNRQGLQTSSTQLEKIGPGGLSGVPLKSLSTEILAYICKKTSGSLPVIASGGIFSGDDAREKFNAGAVLVEVWTGFIYEGPGIVKSICNKIS